MCTIFAALIAEEYKIVNTSKFVKIFLLTLVRDWRLDD